jgi:hypothetical protein
MDFYEFNWNVTSKLKFNYGEWFLCQINPAAMNNYDYQQIFFQKRFVVTVATDVAS